MSRSLVAAAAAVPVALSLSAPPLHADRVITEDGRVLIVRKAREEGDGLRLEFDSGVIELPDRSGIVAVEIEGDMSDYVPKDDDEREKLEQGYVKYRGKWMSKPAYENQLEKEAEESKAFADEIALHTDFHNGWVEETKHFRIQTNTSPELLEYYASLLEAYYDIMDGRFKIKLSPKMRRTKMQVNIYKNRAEFYKMNKAAGIGPGVAGFFSPSAQSLNFYHDYAEPAISDWVSLHECTHLLTYLIDQDYIAQIWLNEAVADYFGSSVIEVDEKGRVEITPGRLQTDRTLTVQQAIEEENDIHLRDLFAITREDFHSFQYAHAWSFVYFLNNASSKYQKAFDSFFKDIYTLKKGIEFETVNYASQSGTGRRIPPEEIQRVVLEALKVKDDEGLEELNAEWKAYIAAIPIEGAEARLKRGYQAVMRGEVIKSDGDERKQAIAQAVDDLTTAIDAGIDDPRAWHARALLRILEGDWKAAREDLESAVAADPLNAAFRFDLGCLETGKMTIGGARSLDDDDFPGLSEHPEAELNLSLAVELAPENDYYARFLDRYLNE
jgi:tetratricopeptide (TPR) repeat protein